MRDEKKRAVRRTRPILAALALPEDATQGAVRLTVLGRRELLSENHRAIAEVSEERIRLSGPDGLISISGEHLFLRDVRRGSARIVGDIALIELPGGSVSHA